MDRGVAVEWQLIKAVTHQNDNSSKWQLTECPLEDPFTEWKTISAIHQIGGNSPNTL